MKYLIRRFVKNQSYKEFDENAFVCNVRKTSWWQVYSSEEANQAAEICMTKFTLILNKHAPVENIPNKKVICSVAFRHN